jgi:excisionase family DNA binding protein
MVQSVEKERKIENNRSENQADVLSNTEQKFFEKKIVSSNWLTTKEAAEYLRTSPNQIRNWVYQGKVKHYKLFNKSLRFKLNELDLLHQGGQVWE